MNTVQTVIALWALVLGLFLGLVFTGAVVRGIRKVRADRRWLRERAERQAYPVSNVGPMFLPMKAPAAPTHEAYLGGEQHIIIVPPTLDITKVADWERDAL